MFMRPRPWQLIVEMESSSACLVQEHPTIIQRPFSAAAAAEIRTNKMHKVPRVDPALRSQNAAGLLPDISSSYKPA